MARALDEDLALRVVDVLAPGQWVSEPQLARTAAVPPSLVADYVQRLATGWLLDVESSPNKGYRLARPLARLSVEDVRSRLPPRWRDRLQLRVVARTVSTNNDALVSAAVNDPQAVMAEMQTSGRGRRGHAWISPFGANLYLSLAWSFVQRPVHMTLLPLVAGICCARVLEGFGLAGVGLKWPNDLRVGDAKLGGILVETDAACVDGRRVVIGVGINVAMSALQGHAVEQPWTALDQAFDAVDLVVPERSQLAAIMVAKLAEGCEQFAGDGFLPFMKDWERLDVTRGLPVTIHGPGEKCWSGVADGIDADGALQVRTEREVRTIYAGNVSLRVA